MLLRCMMEEAFHRRSNAWLATSTPVPPFACNPVPLTTRHLLTVTSTLMANNVAEAVALVEVEVEMEMEISATGTSFVHSRTAS